MSSSAFNVQGRQCPRCGMAWPMNETRCRNCGFLFETGTGTGSQGLGGASFGNNFNSAPGQGQNQASNTGWGQSSSQLMNFAQPNANNNRNVGSGTQWNQFGGQQGSGMQWNQPPSQSNMGSGMQWGTQSGNNGSGMQWGAQPGNNGSGVQWDAPASTNDSATQWNQPLSQPNTGSGMQWGTQSLAGGSGMQWGAPATGNGTGTQWGQPGSPSSTNNSFASFAQPSIEGTNNGAFPSPFGSSSNTPASLSNFGAVSTDNSDAFASANKGNSIPFTPALDPFAASERKKRPRWGMIIGAVILLLVIIGASIGGIFYFSRGNNTASTNTNNTVKQLKPLPTPTGKPLFSDTFQNNNNGWHLEKDDKGAFSVALGKGVLTLADNDNKILWEMLPNSKPYGDFQLFVNATLTKGDVNNGGGGYGLYIRSASTQSGDLATYYRFELYGDGSYSIFKGQSDPAKGKVLQPKELVANTPHSAIQQMGKQNQIVIKAKGPNITFIVNGQTIKTISDSSYLSGSIALFVSNLPQTKPGAEAQFSNLGIYPAE